MGEMADYTIEQFECQDEYWEYQRGACGPHGLGPCPRCGKLTQKKVGKYGTFYGCVDFPKCKGSRSDYGENRYYI